MLAYLAPALIGAGHPVLGAAGVGTLPDRHGLRVEEVVMSGPDIRISAVPAAWEG